MRPGTKVSELLCNLCAATGRDIEETRLVFNDVCLRNKDTLAKSGLQGQVTIGVVVAQPSFTCGGCGKTTDIRKMRRDLHDTRECVWALDGSDYEGDDMPPDPDGLTDSQVLEEWKHEMYMSKILDDDVCLECA